MESTVKLKQWLKCHKTLGKVARFAMRPVFWYQTQKAEFKGWLRSKGYSHPQKFEFLKSLKNTHVGERCFIGATWLSLRIEVLYIFM